MFKPLKDFIVVRLAQEQNTKIVLPDSATAKETDVFEVLAVGPGYRDAEGKLREPDVKEGDLVLIAGRTITVLHSGIRTTLARAVDVIAVKEKVPNSAKAFEK